MATLLGVDVGGTFTDLMCCDDVTGEIVVGKQPTRPRRPSAASSTPSARA